MFGESLSRIEDILSTKIDGVEYLDPPQSRLESLLLRLNIGGGGGDNPDLTSINTRISKLESLVDRITNSLDKVVLVVIPDQDNRITELEMHAIIDNLPEDDIS